MSAICEDYPCCGHERGDCDGSLYGDVAAQVREAWETGHGYCEHESGIFNCDEEDGDDDDDPEITQTHVVAIPTDVQVYPARRSAPEWYIRAVYAESCGAPGTDQYARGVEQFQEFKRRLVAGFLKETVCRMRANWDAGGTIRDPQDPETSYSADRWLGVYAGRLRNGQL